MTIAKTIGIAGCGIGGLALGALLSARGWKVQIFDQFAAPAPVGSGLVVQPVGLQVLQALGAAEAALAKGARISHMYGLETGRDKVVLDVSYGARFGLAIHRASLFDVLLKVAVQGGCKIMSSTKIVGRKNDSFITQCGRQNGPFDVLVDASGASSVLSPLQSRALPYGAIWASVDWPENAPLPYNRLTQCYSRASKMAGVLPIGSLPHQSTRKAAIFWSLKVADFEAWQQQPIDTWKAEATAIWPDFAPFLAQISRHENMTMARYKHGTLSQKTAGNMAFIGDAAHCASPQLGQGANMALLDAFALGSALLALSVPRALQSYNRSRHRHVLGYQLMSRFLTPLYQSDSGILPWLRNHVFAPLSPHWPFAPVLTKVAAGDVIRPVRGQGLALPLVPALPPHLP